MRTQIQPILAPRGGLRFDLPADLINELEMSGGQNVIFEDGLIKKKYGYKTMGDNLPLSGAVIGSDTFIDYSANKSLLLMTTNSIYKWNGATWVELTDRSSSNYGEGLYGEGWYGIGEASGSIGFYGGGIYGTGLYGWGQATSFTGLSSDFCSYTQIRDLNETNPWWICTNGVDEIVRYDGSGDLLNLISSYPTDVTSLRAKYLVSFKNYLVLLDVTENGNRYPQRVRWSDTAQPANFVSGNASYWDIPGPHWIKGAVVFKGDHLLICTERSVWLIYATGDTDIFDVDQIVAGQGCSAGRTIKNLPDEVVFMGWDDVYSCNGIDVEPIGTKVQRELFKSLNPSELDRCFAAVNEDQKEYWLFIVTGTNTYPNEAWIFHYDLRTWSHHTYNDSITAYGSYQLEDTKTFDSLTGTFDEQRWRYNDRTILNVMPTTILGDSDGNVYEYDPTKSNEDGETVDGYFDTKDFNFTKLMSQQRIIRIDVSWIGTGMDVYYSTDQGDSWNLIKSLSDSINFDREQLSFRTSCDWIRFRFRNNASGGWFHWDRANIFWQQAGRIGE